MKMLKLIGAGVIMLMVALPAKAQIEDTHERNGDNIIVTRYYDDGTIREVGSFKKGVPDGRWIEYTRDGKIKIEATYANGEKEGKWFVWTEDGEYLYEVIYMDNKLQDASRWKIEERNALVNN